MEIKANALSHFNSVILKILSSENKYKQITMNMSHDNKESYIVLRNKRVKNMRVTVYFQVDRNIKINLTRNGLTGTIYESNRWINVSEFLSNMIPNMLENMSDYNSIFEQIKFEISTRYVG